MNIFIDQKITNLLITKTTLTEHRMIIVLHKIYFIICGLGYALPWNNTVLHAELNIKLHSMNERRKCVMKNLLVPTNEFYC